MRNASSAFIAKVRSGTGLHIKALLTRVSEEGQWLYDGDFIANSVQFRNASSSDGSFDVGAVIISSFVFQLNNFDGRFDDYNFQGAQIDVYVGYEEELSEPEYLRMGHYHFVSHRYTGNIVSCEAYDSLVLMDNQAPNIPMSGTLTVGEIVSRLCSTRGITLASSTWPNSTYAIEALPEDINTERELLQYLVQICGCYARMNSSGQLYIGWYHSTVDVDEPTMFNQGLQTADINITGVRVTGDETSYLYGTEGYVLEITDNPFITEDTAEDIAEMIGTNVIGMTFRAGSITVLANPMYEVGDTFRVLYTTSSYIEPTENPDKCFVIATNITYRLGLRETITCGAADEVINDLRQTEAHTSAERMKQEVYKNVGRYATSYQSLANLLATGMGFYKTIESAPTGGDIVYFHNKPVMEESDIIWKATIDAFGVSTDGGQTWGAIISRDGNLIAQVLTAVGINADWINSGAITILDGNSNETFYANADTGVVRIVASAFRLSSWGANETIDSHIADEAEDAIDTYDAALDQTAVFNKLTNNRQNQGIYLQNGNLYINASMIQSGTIDAGRLTLRDMTNFSQLNTDTAEKWDFTYAAASGGGWFKMNTIARDKRISDYYTVNGGESYRVKCSISSTCKGSTTSGGGTDSTYLGTAIMLHTHDGNNQNHTYNFSARIAANASGTEGTVDSIVTLPANARVMDVFVQTAGWPTFSGQIWVRNLTVTRMSDESLLTHGYIYKDGTIGTTPAEGSTGFVVSSAGLLTASNAVIYGTIYASAGKIGGFTLSNGKLYSNAKSSLSSATLGVYIADDGIGLGNTSGAANTVGFKVTNTGYLTAAGATISGAITATSLTLGANASVAAAKVTGLSTVATSGSYNDLSNKPTIPDVSIYIAKDGTIGSTPASGATGFKVSSAGLLQASNAIIWGTLYASGGSIGGFTLSNGKLYTNNKSSLSSATLGVYLASDGIGLGNTAGTGTGVKITSSGSLTVYNGIIAGSTISVGDGSTNNAKLYVNGSTGDVWAGNLNIMTTDGYPIGGWYQDDDTADNASFAGHYMRIKTGYGICVGSTTGDNQVNAYSIFKGGVRFYQQVYNNYGGVQFTSDVRKKHDIKDLNEETSLDLIMTLRPVQFRYNTEPKQYIHHGFIAQEIEGEIDPEWAFVGIDDQDKDKTRYLSYTEPIADMVLVIQQQQRRIEELESKVDLLMSMIEKLQVN